VVRDDAIIERARAAAASLVEADPGLERHPELHRAIGSLVAESRADYLEKA